MSSQSGLSGLNAASRNLDVLGNNIANANTVGMKSSRVEFSDLIASSAGGGGGTGGIGVGIAAVSQLFTQGNINVTGRDMDVAINGNGFFQLTMPDGSFGYTRDGQFKLDKDGNLITNAGAHVMGYPTDNAGVATSTTAQILKLPTAAPIAAHATQSIAAEFNLDARILDNAALTAAGHSTNPRSAFGTSLDVYDVQGVASPVNLYFEKDAVNNTWNIYGGIDTPAVVGPPAVAAVTNPKLGQMVFNAAGGLTSLKDGAGAAVAGTGLTLPAGTFASLNPNEPTKKIQTAITIDLGKVTQYGASFAVSNLTQDGYSSGELVGIKIAENGVITGNYSNGQTQASGQIGLTDFRNEQGLTPVGGGVWLQTVSSGLPLLGAPGIGRFGVLRSGSVEESNVDLTAELVDMMTAQRAYQANAQTIKTQDQVMQSIVNMR